MKESTFHEAGTIPKPGWIGRMVRLLSAGLFGYMGSVVIEHYNLFMEGEVYLSVLWFFVLLSLHLLPAVVNIGYGLKLGSRPQWWFVLAFLVSVYEANLLEQSYWGLMSGILVLGLQLYVFIHIGVAFILAAVLATPGCEMRSIPHLVAIIRGKDPKEHFCPGYIDHVDRWERKLLGRSG